jgi:radical SAM superfamily enzyme YgiQ (UPF0313 family)
MFNKGDKMTAINAEQSKKNEFDNKKILLVMLPYWDPMIPPNGIAHLKSFLQEYGYQVKLVDVVVEEIFQEIYRHYYEVLGKYIPGSNRGNFINIGHDALQDILMTQYNYTDEDEHLELIELIVYNSFYVKIGNTGARELNKLAEDFYQHLEKYFLDLLEKEKPAVVGATAYKCTLQASIFVFKLIKKKYPHIKTVMSGGIFVDTHAKGTTNFEIMLEYTKDCLDKIIIGQGELLFLKYLQGNLPDSQRVYTSEDNDSKILNFQDMDVPDFSDFDIDRYPCLPATSSTSCKFRCSFCSAINYYGKYREKDPKQTADEMIYLHKKYGHQLFFMTDSLINFTVTDLARELIKRDVSLYYDAYYRVDNNAANIENTMLWRRGGLYRVRFGAESGSQRVLDLMGKKITPNQIKAVVSAFAGAGIKTTTYFVVGHPGETEQDFQETLNLIKEIKNDIYQAEVNTFQYFSTTQSGSDKWAPYREQLYTAKDRESLIFEFWTLDIEPLRQEAYHRMFRFVEFCEQLGIPNPYSLDEYIKADERWEKLHKYAAPSLYRFLSKKEYIDENKKIKNFLLAKNTRKTEEDFNL